MRKPDLHMQKKEKTTQIKADQGLCFFAAEIV